MTLKKVYKDIRFNLCFLLPSIYVFPKVLADFPFFQITSDYLISYFPRLSTLKTTANLDDSTLRRPSIHFVSLSMNKPLQFSIL